VDPARYADLLADMLGAKFSASMGTIGVHGV
jgi:hypothetical protein